MINNPKILICGGGTGGHVYPAITIIKALQKTLCKLNCQGEFLFIGGKGNLEMKEVPKHGYQIKELWISGFPNQIFHINTILLPIKIIYSYITCLKIINKFNPNIIIGTGGYVSYIPLKIGFMQKIPLIIQEQNVIPGYVNQHIGNKMAKKIFLSYKESNIYFPNKNTIITGNPIRKQFEKIKYDKYIICQKFNLDPKKKIILSIGGSLGAESINNFWLKNIKFFLKKHIQLIWQTGEKNFNYVLTKIQPYKTNKLKVIKYLNNIELAYYIADIVISRAGGLSISEIAKFGKPCILIPLSNSHRNHQFINAITLYKKQAALIINNHDIQNKLLNKILFLINNQKISNLLSRNIQKIYISNSNEKIVNEIIKLL
jgi:UDP-N-acetylglucosamine--N-acetylmuramyl-(pentapeptide) pyrophosphoryl-undecaprenol N-acetylglucosamine transferase